MSLAFYLKIRKPHNGEWLAADVLEFVIGTPQTQEHPRINWDENAQSEVLFHMFCMLVAGFSLCLFKGFRGPDFIFAGYFEETCQGWILNTKRLEFRVCLEPHVASDCGPWRAV